MIDLGDYVEERYGAAGFVTNSFKNFQEIPDRFILDKETWLRLQENPYTEDELKERWFSVEFFGGGQILSCESNLILLQKADIDELTGLI
jgi:hypothetical protein